MSAPKPTKMDRFKPMVDEWLEEAPYSAIRILEKLRELGFDGGYEKAYSQLSDVQIEYLQELADRANAAMTELTGWIGEKRADGE